MAEEKVDWPFRTEKAHQTERQWERDNDNCSSCFRVKLVELESNKTLSIHLCALRWIILLWYYLFRESPSGQAIFRHLFFVFCVFDCHHLSLNWTEESNKYLNPILTFILATFSTWTRHKSQWRRRNTSIHSVQQLNKDDCIPSLLITI